MYNISNNWQSFRPPDITRGNINILELLPILIAARKFGNMWINKRVIVYTDNTQVVSFINRATSKTSAVAMHYLRELFMLTAMHNFHITAQHLSGKLNVIADCLSRLDEKDKWDSLMSYVYNNNISFHLQKD